MKIRFDFNVNDLLLIICIEIEEKMKVLSRDKSRKTMLIITILSVGLFIILGYSLSNHMIKKPENTYQNVDIANYTKKELIKVLSEVIPVGTSKETVDSILTSNPEVQVVEYKSRNPSRADKIFYRYQYRSELNAFLVGLIPVAGPPAGGPTHLVQVEYDEEYKVKNVNVLWAITFKF